MPSLLCLIKKVQTDRLCRYSGMAGQLLDFGGDKGAESNGSSACEIIWLLLWREARC